MSPDFNGILMELRKESARVVKEGGDPIPDVVMGECIDALQCYRYNPHGLKSKLMELVKPYQLTTTAERVKRAKELRASALKSSRFTVLRMKRGLPFKSRRQP